jgi:AraC family transcriptional regulator
MMADAHPISESGLTGRRTIAGFLIKEFSQPPFRRLPWHEHHDASICFVVYGSYSERLCGAGWKCSPHATVFKPLFEGHSDLFGHLGAKCLLVEISPDRLETIEACSRVIAQPNVVRNARVARFGLSIYREFLRNDAIAQLALEALILEALVEASLASAEKCRTRRPAWLRRAHDLICDGVGTAVTLSSVAEAVSVDPSHLARTFRAYYRCSIGDYVRRLRVERASRQLTNTDAPVAEIALRLGFFDQSHFARVQASHRPHSDRVPSCVETLPLRCRSACSVLDVSPVPSYTSRHDPHVRSNAFASLLCESKEWICRHM